MQRRSLIKGAILAGGAALLAGARATPAAAGQSMASSSESLSFAPDVPLAPPAGRQIKVAFIISDGFNMIDMVGPMQTFMQVAPLSGKDDDPAPFETFTVGDKIGPMKGYQNVIVTPNYTFDTVPDADIVCVGAQSGLTPAHLDYLRGMHAKGKLVMSVCTGVGALAKSGLLDGLTATTHHNYIDHFNETYPKVKFVADKAWVHAAPLIFTAGGETSGFELALHIVQLYYGRDVAVATARSMEYRGPAWQA